jgi:hypothetical protein
MEQATTNYTTELNHNDYICDKWGIEIRKNNDVDDVVENKIFNDVELIFKEIRQSIIN